MSEELNKRWSVSVKTLKMALDSEREIKEGMFNAIRSKVTDAYLELVGETGEEPDRPEFADAIFDELYGIDEVGRVDNNRPIKLTPHITPGSPKVEELYEAAELEKRKKILSKKSKTKAKKRTPKSKKKSPPKRKKPVKKSVKKVKKKAAKRKISKKKKAKKRKR